MRTATQRKIQQYQICYGRKSGGAKEAAKTNESAASASEQQEAKSMFPHYRAPAFPSMLLSRVPFPPHLRAGEQWARVAQVTIMSTALN